MLIIIGYHYGCSKKCAGKHKQAVTSAMSETCDIVVGHVVVHGDYDKYTQL